MQDLGTVPTPAEIAASDEQYQLDAGFRADAWALVEFSRRTAARYVDRPALDYPGFGALLDAAFSDAGIGNDLEALGPIAAAVGLHPVALADLRAYTCLATDLEAAPVTALAEALALDEPAFLTLVARDLVARADARLDTTDDWPAGAPPSGRDVVDRELNRLRTAWRNPGDPL